MSADGPETILAGDLGGTKTLLAIFGQSKDGFVPLREASFSSRAHETFDEILDQFLSQDSSQKIDAVCFDVAGLVTGGRVQTTNLPWTLDERALAAKLGTPRVKLLNDLEATAYGMLHLPADALVCLHPGATPPRKGNIAVIAAGTGLGEAFLYFDGTRYHPVASEGGHADFAPRSDLEIGLLKYLRDKLGGHVSYERVLSGPGLHEVYQYLRDTGVAAEPGWLRDEIASGDPGAAISEAALSRHEPLAIRALDMFCVLYGAEAGNMALRCLSFGGVYLGGGIGPKILPALREGFPRGYLDKGRFSQLLADIPAYLALEARTALLGAASFARQL